MQNASDQELIIDLQKGSLDALGILYDRHRRMVYRTALGIVADTEAAADLLQDVFLRLHRFAGRVDESRPLEPWLYRVTANLSYTWVKRRKRWFSPLEDIAEWLSGNKKQTPHHLAELDEESQQVRQAISTLPLRQRVVIVLYYINDLSLLEISEILEVPEGTVKSRLHYGRQALKKHLGTMRTEMLSDLRYEFT
ncbi:MAG TPA: sigma-70 family RNA polymerase sigma factor [Anaerolineales bacterium]|nr:sigma-70 family RNA polymerase sigma factor [Anaerolineales bacterium]